MHGSRHAEVCKYACAYMRRNACRINCTFWSYANTHCTVLSVYVSVYVYVYVYAYAFAKRMCMSTGL